MPSVDHVLLRRIMRALGISVLGVGQQGCDSLRDRGEGQEPASPPDTSQTSGRRNDPGPPVSVGSGGTGMVLGGAAGTVGGTTRIDAGTVTATQDDAGIPPHAPVVCPAEVIPDERIVGMALLGLSQCGSEHFSNQPVCLDTPTLVEGDLQVSCEEARPPDECVLRLYSCGLQNFGDAVVCGPIALPSGECCYIVGGRCPVGRPFVVAGVARLAPLAVGASWCAPSSPALVGLTAPLRAALAEAYRQDGATEHASVASFSRFALQLLAQGAPSELVAAALHAASDEVRHARACLGLAAAYAGVASSPTSLRTEDALREGTGMLHVALSLASEGCVAETISAQLVAAAATRATDPFVRDTLQEITRDEAEHVELAWKALAWLLERGEPELRKAVAGVFARAHEHVGFGARVEHDQADDAMADHGYLSLAERAQIAAETLEQVVRPAARALLTATARAQGNCSRRYAFLASTNS